MGIKNLLFKRVSEMDSVNKQIDTSNKRAREDDEYFKVFISNCKKDLEETGQTTCFYTHLKILKELYAPYIKIEPYEYYYLVTVTRYVVVKLSTGKEKKYPITAKLSAIRGEVLRYE